MNTSHYSYILGTTRRKLQELYDDIDDSLKNGNVTCTQIDDDDYSKLITLINDLTNKVNQVQHLRLKGQWKTMNMERSGIEDHGAKAALMHNSQVFNDATLNIEENIEDEFDTLSVSTATRRLSVLRLNKPLKYRGDFDFAKLIDNNNEPRRTKSMLVKRSKSDSTASTTRLSPLEFFRKKSSPVTIAEKTKGPETEGYLKMHADSVFKSSPKYWFVLDKCSLKYYSKVQGKFIGEIEVKSAQVGFTSKKSRYIVNIIPNDFGKARMTKSRSVKLSTKSYVDFEKWMAAFAAISTK
jgi:hypothetical protein